MSSATQPRPAGDLAAPAAAADLHRFFGPNAGYVLELYDRYQADPDGVDAETGAYFAALDPAAIRALAGPSPTPTDQDKVPAVASTASPADVQQIAGVVNLTIAIREYGHLAVRLDPLGSEPPGAPELLPEAHGLTESILATLPATLIETPLANGATNAAEAISRLRRVYTGTIGYDFDHIQVPAERTWLRDAVESQPATLSMADDAKVALLHRLTAVETFERFLHQTYLGQKRFSLEGNDILVPMLDDVISRSAAAGTREVVMGMAHRGRLNVLTHVLGKPYEAILAAFEGRRSRGETAPSDVSDDRTGDVKYHQGAKRTRDPRTGGVVEIPLVLAPNPSHLEFVNPVVVGMARASQDARDTAGSPGRDAKGSLAILLHGDAAFPGQGIVAETLNLSGLAGYSVGGTIHIIVNNQIGYTTDTHDSRSTLYASDLAKGFEIPILHVNADDPEACLAATRLAVAYREAFHKDFLIDLVGYRRWGHNEGDEPAFTQPRMYAIITKHPTVRAQWAERLVARGLIAGGDAKAIERDALAALAEKRRSVTEGDLPADEAPPAKGDRQEVETAIDADRLARYHAAIHALPDTFAAHPKLARQWGRRRNILDTEGGTIDWAHAESLAFAAILADGTPIRLSGQDAERGTFSQRHMVLHDAKTGERHVPLQRLPDGQASFGVYNSPLSEAAAVGFEYGYSVHSPGTLVLWEAQFGDFSNGAQVLIDQFLVSARAKWRQYPSLVLLLPHGYEGQGPEHSSARLERFLQLAAGDNIRVANVTSAAQYFHLLRRQAARLASDPRPLIIMTPKSLLRHPLAASAPAAFLDGTFRPVLDDPGTADRLDEVRRLVLCSGKVAIDLEESPDRDTAGVAVARVEQLAPFQNTALGAVVERYPNLAEIVWLQEEPRNMGAWSFMEPRLRGLVEDRLPVRYAGRPERASPAEGSADQHAEEQARIVRGAFAAIVASGPAAVPGQDGRPATNGAASGVETPATNGSNGAGGKKATKRSGGKVATARPADD
ncbi:MAG: 2-oxoglutarate dehydrogenase E1 component [Chloroflexota bacterium]|nr:2-oxoglutarate dehydrogenase E1 component [Chloroflexota bacterium]